jgi:PAS domain S-box-containing protein
MLVLLWAQVPALAAVGLAQGASIYEIVVASLLLIVLAVVGMIARSHSFAAAAVALGLVTASGILVRYLNGSIESQFTFFLVIVALSFYRDWLPLLLGFVYVATYHLIAGFIVSVEASTQSSAAANPVLWTSTHLSFTLLLVLLLMGGWRLATRADARGDSTEDWFRLSFERASVGMAVLTPSGQFLHANEALTRILGYDEGHLLGSNIRSVIHTDDLGDLGQVWEEMGNTITQTATTWMRCRTFNGQAIWGRVSLSFVLGTSHQPATVLLQLEDATQAYHEQRRLEGLISGKDEFVAAIGEEIRQPISAVLELTAHADRDGVDLSSTIRRIETHTKELASIVDDLIVSARANTIPVSVVARSVDAGLLCRETLAGVPGAENIPVDVRATYLWADRGLTKRLVSSLVGYAIRYGGPAITLETKSSGPDIVIQVIDDGPEIPLSERERIFSGDLRSGQPVTRPAALGLSLTVCRHLARQMDGDVAYRRTAAGHNILELRLPSEQVSAGHNARTEFESEALGIPA